MPFQIESLTQTIQTLQGVLIFLGRDKIVDILQKFHDIWIKIQQFSYKKIDLTISSNSFSWMEGVVLWLKFGRNVFQWGPFDDTLALVQIMA